MTTRSELEQIKFALDQAAIVAITDVSGRITYANDKFCEISKYSRDELIGQDHRIISSGFHPPEFIRDLWRTIAQGRVWRGELRNRAKDGSIYWVDTTIVPSVDDEGRPTQYLAIRYDITLQKRQEAERQKEAALRALGQMAAVVAHEVRNPLAGIRGGAQIIRDVVEPGSEAHQIAAEIVQRVDALNSVVEDILVFSRHRELRRAPLDITAFLQDLVKSARFDPQLAQAPIRIDAPPQVYAAADVDLLRIVFGNLLANAAQATPGGGDIGISARLDDAGHVVIEIADSGPGLPAEVAEKIFEPFFTTKARGSGLGLPTARRFVEAHGGTLELMNRPGGAVARVTLPVHG
jgi:PAS domain S-box-containing protein